MQFEELRDIYTPTITFPINGTKYTIHAPNAEEGMRLRLAFSNPDKPVVLLEEIAKIFGSEYNDGELSGGMWETMSNDGVSVDEALHVGLTALDYFVLGAEQAVKTWSNLGKAMGDNETADKKKPAKK